MEKIWFAEYRKTGIPETVELPAENTSLVDIFERNFQKFGSRDAFIFMDKALTFDELEEASRKFATYLQSLGLAKGSRVAVMMPNVLQYPVVALGVFRAGLVLVNSFWHLPSSLLMIPVTLGHRKPRRGGVLAYSFDKQRAETKDIQPDGGGLTTVKHLDNIGRWKMAACCWGQARNCCCAMPTSPCTRPRRTARTDSANSRRT